MTDLDRLLDAYPSLSPAERAQADRLLASHPERGPDWARARRLAGLIDAAGPDRLDDLARRAVDQRMGRSRPGNLPDTPEAARLGARLDDAEAHAQDSVARFERMTGRRLVPARPDRAPIGGDSVPQRPHLAPRTSRRLPRLAAVAAVLVVGYGAAWMASAASVTPREQLADLGGIEAHTPPTLRGAQATESEALTEALQAVRDARRSTLGLFPWYSPAGLDAAAADLASVAERTPPASWRSQEARLALARVHLARQRDAQAAHVLGELVREGQYRAPVARRLLDAIRAGLPADGPRADG